MDASTPTVAEERPRNWYQMMEAHREALKTRLNVPAKKLDFVVRLSRCFRDLFQFWAHTLLRSPPLTGGKRGEEEARETKLEEAYIPLRDSLWRQLLLDFPGLGKSRASACVSWSSELKFLAPLLQLEDGSSLDPDDLYTLSWENSSWQQLTDEVKQVTSRHKIITDWRA